MLKDIANVISERYIELYEHITGEQFIRQEYDEAEVRVFANVQKFLRQLD